MKKLDLHEVLAKFAAWEKRMGKYYFSIKLVFWSDGSGIIECQRSSSIPNGRLMDKHYSSALEGFSFNNLEELSQFLKCKGYA